MSLPSNTSAAPAGAAAAASDTQPAVLASGLRKSYGKFEAVRGIDFSVKRGEFFGFLGPNGAGKSTTMRMLYGFTTPTSGTLHVLGRDTATDLREIKRRIGVVHQDDNLDIDLTCREVLLAYSRYFGMKPALARSRADELLEFFQLSEKADTSPERLSGGMKRRLMLARALIHEPELLILDEPTTGLDPQARHLLWHRLRELRRRGITILLTSHYMDEVEMLCDRLVLINEGRIISEGSPAQLIREVIGAEMLEIEVVDDAEREKLRDRIAASLKPGTHMESFGDRLYIAVGPDERIEEGLRGAALGTRWWRRPATLEDVFLRVSGRALGE